MLVLVAKGNSRGIIKVNIKRVRKKAYGRLV